MNLTALILASIVAVSVVASDDRNNNMIRGGGAVAVATADDVEAVETATHNVLRGVNFYEAAAQGDYEDIPTYCTGCGNPCGNSTQDNVFIHPCDHSPSPCSSDEVCEPCSGAAYFCRPGNGDEIA
jgi:hypothetical protein